MSSGKIQKISDEQIWEQFIQGDRMALSIIYQQHYRPLFNYGYKLYPDTHLVEDCVQDLFLDIWKSKERLGSTNSIRYYLLRSIRRKIFQAVQKKKKLTNVDWQEVEYAFEVEYSIEDQLIGQTHTQEQKLKLTQALSQLSARQKEVIYLKFYNDLDYHQIGLVMELTYQSIRTLVYRAIQALRQSLLLVIGLLFTSWPIVL